MATATITISVDEEAAKAYTAASVEEQRKMQLLLSLLLVDLTAEKQRELKVIMDEIGAQAEAAGLTPDILNSLLDGERSAGHTR